MGDPAPTVVHVAILEGACHAGGRGSSLYGADDAEKLRDWPSRQRACGLIDTEPLNRMRASTGVVLATPRASLGRRLKKRRRS
jgi:hypothetical protein